jgi:hypothetical protein
METLKSLNLLDWIALVVFIFSVVMVLTIEIRRAIRHKKEARLQSILGVIYPYSKGRK